MTYSPEEFCPVIGMFSDRAAQFPDAIAVRHADASITYGELAGYAKEIAADLSGRGLPRNSVLALRMHRGVQQIGAMLAALDAGCGFVLIDPDAPGELTRMILRDAAVPLVLTSSGVERPGALPGCPDVAVITRAGSPAAAADRPGAALPDEIACVIYTSGSTGTPKGVAITQRGLWNRMRDSVLTHGFTAADRILNRSNVAFDGAVWEVLSALLSGASLVLADGDLESDPDAIARAVGRYGVTVLQAVPTMLKQLLKASDLSMLLDLRMVLAVGERLDLELAQELSRWLPAELWNCYGPTECTVSVTEHLWAGAVDAASVPIGRAIRGIGLHVLDDELNEVGAGGSGELYISGQGLARGYVRQPALTAERFVPSTVEPGARMYRTGDRVKRIQGGVLEYIGRIDDQLKVNGVRIEPSGIEEVIRSHPAVDDVAVFARAGDGQLPYLAAAVVDNGTLDVRELRSYLQARLARSHVPSLIWKLPALPTTQSGKVDRNALNGLVEAAESTQTEVVAPRNRHEELVVAAWRAALGRHEISVYDDFFQLGGSSVSVPVVAAHLREACGVKVPIIDLYEMSTVQEQAGLIEGLAARTQPAAAVEERAVYPLSPGQEQVWLADQLAGSTGEYVMSLLLEIDSAPSLADVREVIGQVARRHAGLRTVYAELDGGLVQMVGAGPAVEVSETRLESASVTGVIRAEIERGFDIKSEPAWRVLLIRRHGQPATLLITAHHIAADGWSMAIFERELTARLRTDDADAASLPGPGAQEFGAIAEQRRRSLESGKLERQRAYWRRELRGVQPLDLPTDRPRPPVRDPRARALTMTLPRDVVEGLQQAGRSAGASPYAVLLSVFAMTLANYTCKSEVTVATLSAGRSRPEHHNVIGYFVNTLLIRLGFDEGLTFTDLLKLTKQKVAEAFRNQDVPYDLIVAEACYRYDRSRNAGLEAVFNWRDTGISCSQSDFLTSEPGIGVERRIIGDIVLNVQHGEGDQSFVFEYSTALFDRSTMEQFVKFFAMAAEQVAADPATGVFEAIRPSAPDRAVLIADRSASGPEREPDPIRAFEETARLQPGLPAITGTDSPLTYGELNGTANQLARVLRRAGAGAEAVVRLRLADRSDLLVAMLAVWKAGGAVQTADGPRPRAAGRHGGQERQLAVIDAADAAATAAAGFHPVAIRSAAVHDEDRGDLGVARAPGSAAYVVIGRSPAQPAVAQTLSHARLADYAWMMAGHCTGENGGDVPAVSPPGSVRAAAELLAPLAARRSVFLPAADRTWDTVLKHAEATGTRFGFGYVNQRQLRHLAWEYGAARLGSAFGAIVVHGTAACRPPDAEPALAKDGPRICREWTPEGTSVPAGLFSDCAGRAVTVRPVLPFPAVSAYVCRKSLGPACRGIIGSLYLADAGVREYTDEPVVTARRLVPDPLSGRPGGRMHDTGNLARIDDEGQLQIIVSLTSDGEIDMAAVPEAGQAARGEQPARPVTALVGELAKICGELLGIDDLNGDDDFLKFGGNSLRAIRLRGMIRSKYDINIPLQALLESRTIRQIAEQVESAMDQSR